MGYSCSAKADFTLDACMMIVKEGESSNTIRGGYFYERGRENTDGAITAAVWRLLPGGYCKRSGSIRIERDGKITRFPTMTVSERKQAEKAAEVMYKKLYPTF